MPIKLSYNTAFLEAKWIRMSETSPDWSLMQEGLDHHHAGRFPQAEAKYREVLSLYPQHPDALNLLGVIAHQRGDHEKALDLIGQAMAAAPDVPEYHNTLGETLRALGKFEDAAASFREALALDPEFVAALNNLGNALHEQGGLEEAVVVYRKALDLKPEVAEIYLNLGKALHGQEMLVDAESAYRQALSLGMQTAQAHFLLGDSLAEQGSKVEAIEAYQRALELEPDHFSAFVGLGNAHLAEGELTEALGAYEKALAMEPNSAGVHNNLGRVYEAYRELDRAIAEFERAIQLDPSYLDAQINLGRALYAKNDTAAAVGAFRKALALDIKSPRTRYLLGLASQAQGNLSEAIAQHLRAIALQPDHADAFNSLGTAYQGQGKLAEAIDAYRQSILLKPELAEAYNNMGNALGARGEYEEAIEAYRGALALKPDYAMANSNLLFCLNYLPNVAAEEVFAEYLRWADRHAPASTQVSAHDNDNDPERRLRIGYVSPDFRTHSVSYFIEPLLAAHDREHYQIFGYSDVRQRDGVTERLAGLADQWRDVVALDDEQLAELVRADGIDVLVDLAGHSSRNRLGVFAQKPAPVQVSYLGYPNTTGLPTMDYRLTDSVADPPGESDEYYTEELIRLPQCFVCYRPPEPSPDVQLTRPAAAAGHVTFGSFNNASKATPEVIELWSRILKEVPESRLIIKSRQFEDEATRNRFTELFAACDVPLERIDLYPHAPDRTQHLALYNKVDIGLDPFPYNGTTTTCEALWMGVPVIVMAGRVHASRVGASLMSSLGLEELVAQDPLSYLQRAVSLASDVTLLSELRFELRGRLAVSPICDADQLTLDVEGAYRSMWQQWCRSRT